MERAYSTGTTNSAVFFTGDEIEHTPAYEKRSLFVVGLQNFDEIIAQCSLERCDHVYLGANHSYKPDSSEELERWDNLINQLLRLNMWVTLDVDSKYIDISCDLLSICSSYDRFIPMLSFKVPYISNLNYNTCVKIDDKDFRATNPGVWVHYLHDLMDRGRFTDWSKYENDVILDVNTTEAKE
jgi:hypothetical protein